LTTAILGEELLEEIGTISFAKCTALHEILIPDAVKVIKYEAFSLCTQLAIVALGEGLEKIGAGAFLGCTSLHAISIPPSSQGYNGCDILRMLAFDDCDSWRGPGGDLGAGILGMHIST
jgi:hypothetical protein